MNNRILRPSLIVILVAALFSQPCLLQNTSVRISVLEAERDEARAQVDAVSKRYEQLKKMLTQTLASQSEFERGGIELAQAQAKLASAEAALANGHDSTKAASVELLVLTSSLSIHEGTLLGEAVRVLQRELEQEELPNLNVVYEVDP